jgi:hypothetical protein
MVIFRGDEELAGEIARKVPEATHVVYRETIAGNWEENIYFMIHGARRDTVNAYIETITRLFNIETFQKLYSLTNLKVRS